MQYKGKETDFQQASSLLSRDIELFVDDYNKLTKALDQAKISRDKANTDLSNLTIRQLPSKPTNNTGKVAGWTFGISGVIVIILLVFHIIIWILNLVFNIELDTWGWTKTAFIWGIAISGISTFITYLKYQNDCNNYQAEQNLFYEYIQQKDDFESIIDKESDTIDEKQKDINELLETRYSVLKYAIQKNLTIPISVDHFDENTYSLVKQKYFDLLDLKKKVDQARDIKERIENQHKLYDEKLKFFYEISIKTELSNEDVYSEFNNQINTYQKNSKINVLRSEIPVKKSRGFSEINKFENFKSLLFDNKLKTLHDRFLNISNRDTRGFLFFTDTDKKSKQTMDMLSIVSIARDEYKELSEIGKSVTYALRFVRGCAYRNIYLGVELLNFIRDNAGGATLDTIKDSVTINRNSNEIIQISRSKLVSQTSNVAKQEFSNLTQNLKNFYDIAGDKFIENNPKVSAAVAAVSTAVSIGRVFEEHVSTVLNNESCQRKLSMELDEITTNYTKGQGEMLRAIEIIEGIIESNAGFMAIYEPLCKKVFFNNDVQSVQKEELLKLASAINAFRKTTKSTIY